MLAAGLVRQAGPRERRVADLRVEGAVVALAELGEVGHLDVLLRVQVARDAGRDALALDEGEPAGRAHAFRHQADEIADTAAGLKDLAASEPEALERDVDALDDLARRVVGVLRRLARRGVLFLVQQALEFGVLARPLLVLRVEGARQAAPTDVQRQRALLVRGGVAPGSIKLLQQADGRDVSLVLGLVSTLAEGEVFLDAEVDRVELRRLYSLPRSAIIRLISRAVE